MNFLSHVDLFACRSCQAGGLEVRPNARRVPLRGVLGFARCSRCSQIQSSAEQREDLRGLSFHDQGYEARSDRTTRSGPVRQDILGVLKQLLRSALVGSSLVSCSPLLAQADPMALPGPVAQASQQTGQQTSATALRDSATNAGDVGQTMKDKMFLRGVVEEGIAQVKFGELAQLRAASEELKAFGKKMVEEHTAVNGEMAPIADSMGVRLPEEMNRESQAEYNKLKDLSGSDFETEYLTVMVKSHHKAMRDFRLEEAGVSDPALRAAVIKGEGTIHEHLMMVNKLARDKGVTMPGRGNRPATPPGA